MDKTSLGDRMKWYESQETQGQFLPQIPVIVRLDGRAFSKFTKPFERPIDHAFREIMVAVTKSLVDKSNAVIGYTQSDEITLILHTSNPKSDLFFKGRKFKLLSSLAAMASVRFNRLAEKAWPEYMDALDETDNLPTFDCRCFQVPSRDEAVNAVLWRELDATKNAIQMAASTLFSHRELMNKNTSQQQEMMWKKGVNFNDYPAFFKRGTYIKKVQIEKPLDPATLAKIPEDKRPEGNVVFRSAMIELKLPPLNRIVNRVAVVFDSEKPALKSEVAPKSA